MSLLTHWGQLAASYRHLAEHDQLTGALNRHGLFNRAGEFPVGTLIVLADIDRFKAANDEYGHQLGDRLLLAAASKLRELMGEHAAIARMGGDEFVALAARGVGAPPLPTLVHIEVDDVTVSVSLGFAVLASDLDEALAHADAAMYRHKHSRRSLSDPPLGISAVV